MHGDARVSNGSPRRWLRVAIARIDALPAPHVVLGSVALGAFVSMADFVTGSELSFSIFYLAPVMLIAWRLGRDAGLTASVIAAVAWMLTDRWSGGRYSQPLIPFWNGFVRLGFFALITALIAELRLLLRQHADDANVDELTGVLNRRGFSRRSTAEIDRARRLGTTLTLAYIDLDGFKAINDTAGHAAGDAVLIRVGTTARESLRAVDVVGRIGGDEFAVLMPDTSEIAARHAIERLRDELSSCGQAPIAFTFGVVSFGDPPIGIETALTRADEAMYRAKQPERSKATAESPQPPGLG